MSSENYFKNPAIGSSTLSSFIKGQDYALKEIKPTGFMENGKIWEAWLEEQFTGKKVFSDRYYFSELPKIPESKSKLDLQSIIEICEADDIEAAISGGYVMTGKGVPSLTYKPRHRILDEIKDNGYKFPVCTEIWETVTRCWENFQRAKVEINGREGGLVDLFQDSLWQQEYFWTHENSAKCRMKSDVEAYYGHDPHCGFLADVKFTANMNTFRQNWSSKYV